MKLLIAAVWLISGMALAFAQAPDTLWCAPYGGAGQDEFQAMAETADGGFLLAGRTTSAGAGSWDYWVVKTDPAGAVVWNRTLGGVNQELCYDLCLTADGGSALAGYTMTFGGGIPTRTNFWLVRLAANGDSLWSRAYGGASYDECYAVTETADGGFVLAGGTRSFGAGNYDFWIVRTNANGDSLWSRTLGGLYADMAYAVLETTDGGIVVTGRTQSFGAGGADLWLAKLSAAGDSLWSRTYGGAAGDVGVSLAETAEGGLLAAGNTGSFGAGEADYYLLKTNAAGEVIWSRTYGGSGHEDCASVCAGADGSIALGGSTRSFSPSGSSVWLVKASSTGDSLWSTAVHADTACFGYAGGVHTADGGYAVGGCVVNADPMNGWLVRWGPDMPAAPFHLVVEPITDSLRLSWRSTGYPYFSVYSDSLANGNFSTFEGSTPDTFLTVPQGASPDTVRFYRVTGVTAR